MTVKVTTRVDEERPRFHLTTPVDSGQANSPINEECTLLPNTTTLPYVDSERIRPASFLKFLNRKEEIKRYQKCLVQSQHWELRTAVTIY